MPSYCINLKYLALIVFLSFSWIAHDTHAAISSTGTPVFEGATGGFPFSGYKSTDYDNPGPGMPRPFSVTDQIVQIKWGVPFNDDFPFQSAYILYNETTNPVILNQLFTIATLEHVNKPIVGRFITEFDIQITANLNVNGTDVGPINFSDLLVKHEETLNPNPDIATWESNPQLHHFSVSGVDYTLTITGINPNYDPDCPGRCFITAENTSNFAPIQAILTTTPVPEPSTYLLLSSMVGLVILSRHFRSKKQASKVKVLAEDDTKAKY